jgi:hypothetical protein
MRHPWATAAVAAEPPGPGDLAGLVLEAAGTYHKHQAVSPTSVLLRDAR